jgi:tetratricopeptide (TPR) repeat protein
MQRLWIACLFALTVLLRADRAWAEPTQVSASDETSTAYERGVSHLRRGEYDQARRVAENALRADPGNPRLHLLLGLACRLQGDLDEAIQAFTKAVRLAPHEFWAYADRGGAYAKKGDWARAVADYTEALRLKPNDALIHVSRAVAYKALGDQRRVRQDLDSAQRSPGPDRADEQEQLAHLYCLLGETERALGLYTEAISNGRQVVSVYLDRGCLYAAQKDWPHALADFNEAVKLDPGAADCYYNRASAYWNQRRYAEARADLERACERASGGPPAYGLALLLASCPDATLRDGQRAVKVARTACEQTGFKDPACLDVLASACAEAGHWDEAVRWAEEALRLTPEDLAPVDLAEGARLRLELFRLHEPFRRLPPDRPENQPVSSAVEALLYGVARGEAGDYAGAIVYLRKAVELNPGLIAAQYNLALAFSHQGDAAEAALHFSRCLDRNPKHIMALSNRAQAYLVLGKNQEALADAEAALALDPRLLRARYARAWALSNLGKAADALSELNKMDREHPSMAGLRVLRGHCYVLQGRYAEAASELTEAVQGGSSCAEAYADRAVAMAALGKVDEGKRDLEKCAHLTPFLRGQTEARMKAVRKEQPGK